ncbi:MAG: hypothetical protein CHACPFDD_02312 [Phycisphaerae bacterium]|nr:hypothetical protein [Phycisphaerae bacterium]
MNGKSLIPLVIGLCIGGFALKLVFDTLKKARGAAPETTVVWAPQVEIPFGTAIRDEMLSQLKFPAKLVPEGAFREKDKEKLIGRVVRTNTAVGLPILDGMLHPPGTLPGLVVKPGLRAVSIKVDEGSGVSNLLQPGCRVDVVGYFKVTRNAKQETISRTLIQDCEIVAVGERINPAGETADPKGGKSVAPKQARAVTVAVKPEDVPIIHLAEQRGKIKLSMRGEGDAEVASKDDVRNEAQVLGIPEESADGGEDSQAMMQKVTEMLAERDRQLQQRIDALAGGVGSPDGMQLAWRMKVWNGEDCTQLGWKTMDSMEPVELKLPKNARGQAPKMSAVPPAVQASSAGMPAAANSPKPGAAATAQPAPSNPAPPDATPSPSDEVSDDADVPSELPSERDEESTDVESDSETPSEEPSLR